MRAEITQTIDLTEYENFMRNNNSSFYHSKNHILFLSELLKIKPYFVQVKNNCKLLGILPFFLKSSSFGSVINSLPFFGSYGGIISSSDNISKLLLEELNNFIKKNDVISTTIVMNPFLTNSKIYEKYFEHNFIEKRRIQCIDLDNYSEESLWQNFEQRVRRSVRKSMKENLTVSKISLNNESIDNFFYLHEKEMKAKGGKPKPIEFFKSIKNNFVNDVDYNIYEVKKDGKSISYLLTFYHYPYTEYYMPAYDSEYKNTQSTSLLIWESIKTSINKKFKFYNFGGTWFDQPELYLFKRGWNADDYFYNYYIYADVEQIQDIGIETISKNFPYFFVVPFDKI